MNDLNEFCSCKHNSSQPEFACNCGSSMVFLCNICVIPHLREQKPHSLLSIDQARNMIQSDSEFKKRYAEEYRTYSLYKINVQDYIVKINNFISKIEGLRASVINQVNAECDRKIEYLRELEADLNSKFERLSSSIAASEFSEIAKYRANERGVLEGYPDQFKLYEDEFKSVVGNMISIGTVQEILPSIQDLESIIELLKTDNDELTRKIQEYHISNDANKSKIEELTRKLQIEEDKIIEYERRLSSYEKLEKDSNLGLQELDGNQDQIKVIIKPKHFWILPQEIIIQKSDYIIKLRKKVKKMFNCSKAKLYYNKIELNDWECIDSYDISNGSIIDLKK